MKTSKETDRGKKRNRGKPSPIVETGGFVQIHFTLGDGGINPAVQLVLVTAKELSKCEDLPDFQELLTRKTASLTHILPGDILFRLANQDNYILTFEDFKQCLSETTFTDPIQAIVLGQVFHGAKRLSDLDTLIAQYKVHGPSLSTFSVNRMTIDPTFDAIDLLLILY